jgi:hypothetical protein
MQKWYYANASAAHAQVIRTTSNGAAACKICGAAYKSAFKKADGKRASLLETNPDGPYISLVVVTKHDSNPTLFNTKFRLSFGSSNNEDIDERASTLLIGRSSTCNMILDYRTVSTVHAKLSFIKKQFYLEDCGSSNGTMVYLREPIPLPYNKTVKIRNGRSTLSFAARRSWAASFRDAVFSKSNNCTSGDPGIVSRPSKFLDSSSNNNPTPEQLMSIMVATSSLSTSIKSRNNSPGPFEKDNTPNIECRPCEPFTQIQSDIEEPDEFADVIHADEDLEHRALQTKSLDISGLDNSPTYLPHSVNAPPARIPKLEIDNDIDISCTNAGLFASIRRPGSPNKSSGPNSENNSPIRISRIDINTNNGDNNDVLIVQPSNTNSYNSNYYSDQSYSSTNTSRTNDEKDDKGTATIITSKEVDAVNIIEPIIENPSSSADKDSNNSVNEI